MSNSVQPLTTTSHCDLLVEIMATKVLSPKADRKRPQITTAITPVETAATLSLIARPYFCDFVSLCCGLYTIANIVVLPRSKLSTTSRTDQDSQPVSPTGSDPLYEALGKVSGGVTDATDAVSIFTAVFPTYDGYVNRSDFLQLRLQDCPYPIDHIHECLSPLEKYNSWAFGDVSGFNLPDMIEKHAAAIVKWADVSSSLSITELQTVLAQLTQELHDRLNNTPWLSRTTIERKRVALIRGRPNITAGGPVYCAAKALGLDLVIVDEEGHWLQADTEENKKHREAFLVTDMTEDEGVADRMIQSIKSYPHPIHGVFTLSDNFFVAVAKVAKALGLPASPVSAYETSVDKYRSRLAQDSPGHAAKVSSVDEMNALLAATTVDDNKETTSVFSPTFPMVVKPTKGWSSECVSKVNKLEDLAIAVEKATKRHGSAAVIEPFFEGPEIDANFVLLDGEILFSEIADEPSCDADAANASVNDTFSPVALTMPSLLPAEEQALAKRTLRDILVKLGFRTGVFHVEARMVNSACEYRDIGNGVIDLVRKKFRLERPICHLVESTVCRLVEINARPPGYRVTLPVKQTYGVDYFAAHMLAAVGEYDRLRLVAHPFDHHRHNGEGEAVAGAQYWSRLVYISAPRAGTVKEFKSGLDPCDELQRRRPDLAKHIVLATDYCKPGDKLDLFTDGARTYVAHLLVCSRVSRVEAIEIGNEVVKAFEIEVVDED
ncbi:hypothetical protein B0H66DRAFT_143385 [Apodospora peruviana]|uniref:ATP-grasp domain-containing protein n=1 Tax=Apodospora peruviana TaxID=516989 RepID=A0AAE0IIV1_9PEZI|nr:hypothetical protein B0H66DRAFT_143385 [Apodospora peruviana]